MLADTSTAASRNDMVGLCVPEDGAGGPRPSTLAPAPDDCCSTMIAVAVSLVAPCCRCVCVVHRYSCLLVVGRHQAISKCAPGEKKRVCNHIFVPHAVVHRAGLQSLLWMMTVRVVLGNGTSTKTGANSARAIVCVLLSPDASRRHPPVYSIPTTADNMTE